MLSLRQIKIIVYLMSSSDWVSGERLAGFLSVNRKTLLNDLYEIDSYYGKECVIETGKKGYRLTFLSEAVRNQMSIQNQESPEPSLRFRSSLILLYLMFLKDYISMQELADRFYISKTAVSMELETVRRWITRNPGLDLEVSVQKGIRLLSTEPILRIFLCKFASKDAFTKLPFNKEFADTYITTLESAKRVIRVIVREKNEVLTGEAFRRMSRYLAVAIMRSKTGFLRDDEPLNVSEADAVLWRECVSEICRYKLSGAEINDLAQLYDACDFLGKTADYGNRNNVIEGLRIFDQNVSELLEIPETGLLIDETVINYLCQMEKRQKIGFIAINNMNEYIVARYPLAVYLTYRYSKDSFGYEPNREMSYFSIQLGEALCRLEKPLQILLVTNSNENAARGIINDIQEIVIGVRISKIVPDYLFLEDPSMKEEYDILLTTEMNVILTVPDFYFIHNVMMDTMQAELRKYINFQKEKIMSQRRINIKDRYYRTVKSDDKEIQELRSRYLNDPAEIRMYPHGCALLIRIKPDLEPQIVDYQLAHASTFGTMKIRRLISVSYPVGGADIHNFFLTVSEILSEC